MASDELLKQLAATIDKLDRSMVHEHQENRRFQHEMMKRLERWSIAVEARMVEMSEAINDQGGLIRAQTEALQRVLDRLPPATS